MSEKLSNIVKLRKVFLTSFNHVIPALKMIENLEEQKILAKSFNVFFIFNKKDSLVKWAIKSHIKEIDSSSNLFLENSLPGLLVLNYFDLVGEEFRNEVLTPVAHLLKSDGSKDESKVGEIIKTFIKSLKKTPIPNELKHLIHHMHVKILKRFDNPHEIILKFLLAFFIPHLLNTLNGDLTDIHDDLRNVLLMSVTCSLLENDPELTKFNPIIKKSHSKLSSIITKLLTNEDFVSDKSIPDLFSEKQESVAFNCIHYCVYINKLSIVNNRSSLNKISAHQTKALFDLIGILDELELAEGKPELENLSVLGYHKSESFLRNIFKVNTKNETISSKKGKVPFVKQQSEIWNKQHQILISEQKKREDDQKEKQLRKNTYVANKKAFVSNVSSQKNDTIGNDVLNTVEESEEKPQNVTQTPSEEVEDELSKNVNEDNPKSKSKNSTDKEQKSKPPKRRKKKSSQDFETVKKISFENLEIRQRSGSFNDINVEDLREPIEYMQATINLTKQLRSIAIDKANHEQDKTNYLNEIENLRKEIVDFKSNSEKLLNQMFNFNHKLINSIIHRKETRNQINHIGLSLRRERHPSLDDDMYDFSTVAPDKRRNISLIALKNSRKERDVKPKPKKKQQEWNRVDSIVRYANEVFDEVESTFDNKTNDKKEENLKIQKPENQTQGQRGMKKRSVSESGDRQRKIKIKKRL